MTRRFIVYGLFSDGQCRYIGKSSSGLERPRTHGCPCRLADDRTHKANWIRSLKKRGLDYDIQVLEQCANETDLTAAERRWIAHARAQGWPITNATLGGEGMTGWSPSPETRATLSRIARNYPPEVRARITEASNKAKQRPEFKAMVAQRNRDRGPASPITRQRMAEAHRGKVQSPSTRARMSEGMRAAWSRRRAELEQPQLSLNL